MDQTDQFVYKKSRNFKIHSLSTPPWARIFLDVLLIAVIFLIVNFKFIHLF
jgi:hypothetical protein